MHAVPVKAYRNSKSMITANKEKREAPASMYLLYDVPVMFLEMTLLGVKDE